MKRKIFFLLFLTLAAGIFGQVSACPFYSSTPSVCEMYGKAQAIFAGKAVKINELLKDEKGDYDEIYFQVKESFSGAKKNIVVKVRMNAGIVEYCDFKVGESYLVYAYKGSQNDLFTDGSSRTRLLAEADEDLDFLRNAERKGSGSRIYGTVKQFTKSSLEKDNWQPMAALTLKIERRGGTAEHKTFEVFTDADGKYEIDGLAAGDYAITPNLIEGTNFDTFQTTIKVGDKGCVKQDFEVKPVGQIKGRVVDAEGNPVKGVTIEVVPVDFVKPAFDVNEGGELCGTDADGAFVLSGIAPGRYNLAVSYNLPPDTESPFPETFYPNTFNRSEAAIIEIEAGQKIEDLEFRLSARLAEKKIKGSVKWADGKPASGVEVNLKEDQYSICCVLKSVKTDANGNFVLVGYENRTYRIWTYSEKKVNRKMLKYFGASALFTPSDNLSSFRIVLNSTPKYSLDALDEVEIGERGKTP